MGTPWTRPLSAPHHSPPAGALPPIVVTAAVLGAATGWICHRWRIQPLVVSLGMGSMASGASVAWTQGKLNGTPPPFLTDLTSASGSTFGLAVPPIVVIWGVLAVLVAVVLHRTALGRRLFATGANPRAAALARIDTKKVWVTVFATSAVCSALVGALLAGFAGADQS